VGLLRSREGEGHRSAGLTRPGPKRRIAPFGRELRRSRRNGTRPPKPLPPILQADNLAPGINHRSVREMRMVLKAPGILTFLLSIVLALAVLFARYFGTSVPLLTGDVAHFYGLLAAYVILLLGCIMRGL
jgi:hypothetical protein